MSQKNNIITVQGVDVHVTSMENEDYIDLTDMTKNFKNHDQLLKNWLQNKNTIEFLGVWERMNNENFNLVEFHQIRSNAGLNSFVMSTKGWVEKTNAIGVFAKPGRYGGTFAHKDIAFEFGSWLSPEFKLFLMEGIPTAKRARK